MPNATKNLTTNAPGASKSRLNGAKSVSTTTSVNSPALLPKSELLQLYLTEKRLRLQAEEARLAMSVALDDRVRTARIDAARIQTLQADTARLNKCVDILCDSFATSLSAFSTILKDK